MSQQNGLALPPELLAQIQKQPSLAIAQPMNDVQLIALTAANLYHARPSANADTLLDMATHLVAGAFVRVEMGIFGQALKDAKEQAQAQV